MRTEVCRDDREIAAFLDSEFDGTPGLLAEFPLLVGARNRDRRRVLRESSGEIVAHAAWRPLELLGPARAVAAAGIGLVTTRRDRRGRGFAGELVESCCVEARDAGAEIALLFGIPTALYARLGFVPVGRERVTRVEPGGGGQHARGAKGRMRAARPGDVLALCRLLEAHELRVARTCEEFAALAAIPDTTIRVLELESGGELAAYCVEGKGRDLRGVVHEWAGEPSAVADLLGGLGEPFWLLSPGDVRPPVEGPDRLGSACQIRILRPDRLGSDDPRLLFGDAETPARIPFYVWGLDSV